MSLLSRLLNLNTSSIPLEDFFTEVVAYLFSTNKEILYAWLEHINLLDTNTYLDAHISTQRAFEPLDSHLAGSRPDIFIELVDESNHDIIFVESKIGSQEGDEQLSRYVEILHKLSGFRDKFLVYITRDFDPKSESVVLKGIPKSNVKFKQLRWHQFYQFLQSYIDIMLVKEITIFMQEYRMAHNNQFSSIDVLALANFTKALKLMEETMWGKVSQRFKEVVGAIKQRSTALTEVQRYERYLMSASMPSGGWWCGLGFLLKTSNLADYPTVRLMLEVAPNSHHRAKIIDAMKDICNQFGWQGYGLNEPKAWSGIAREKSLRDFLSQEDHIAAIEEFFLQALNELDEIKRKYSQLPWRATPENGENLEDESLPAT
jgi:hypothetical protein